MRKLLFLLYFLCPLLASAQSTFTAATCNRADVQTAITNEQVAPVDGDIISIPSGTCTWLSVIAQTFPNSVTIQGAGAVSSTANGASTTGADQTIIIDNTGGNGDFNITTTAGKSFHVTGIDFATNASSTAEGTGMLIIGGQSTSVRVDHCHIDMSAFASKGIGLIDAVLGVADHIYLVSPNGSTTNPFAFLNGGKWNGETDGAGTNSWADGDFFGTSKFFYVEDSRFIDGYLSDCSNGGRWVVRYSTMLGVTSAANHGTHDGNPVPIRGCRAAEMYQDIWDDTSNGPNGGNMEANNSGPALVWGNTATKVRFIVGLSIVRQNNGTYSEVAPPNGWGYCGNTQTGSTSVWDQNTTNNGYACLDQPGRGKGDLLSLNTNWPSVVNTSNGNVQTWPRQALSPVYVWNNTYNDAGYSPEGCVSDSTGILVDNQDFYQQFTATFCEAGTFDGTKGIGQGLLSARTATCTAGPGGNTPGVGYWATDTNTLYVCNPTNTWIVYYTPYTYPHPLVQNATTGSRRAIGWRK